MQNWLMCAELKRHRNRKILHILYSNIALSSAMTAATFSAKHFSLKIIRYFAILCINATVTGVRGGGHNFKLYKIFKLYAFGNFGCLFALERHVYRAVHL